MHRATFIYIYILPHNINSHPWKLFGNHVPLKTDYHILNTCYSLKNFIILLSISLHSQKKHDHFDKSFPLVQNYNEKRIDTVISLYRNSKKEEKIRNISPKLSKDSQNREDIFFSIFP